MAGMLVLGQCRDACCSWRRLALLMAMGLGAAAAVAAQDIGCVGGSCAAEVDEPTVLLKDMKLYDDSRWEYTKRTFAHFAQAVDDLAHHTVSPEDATRLRLRLMRSVDVMSYTLDIQELYERFPPRALHDGEAEDGAGSVRDRLIEGASLWCHVKDAADPQAHERRILQRLLTGLSHQPVGKEALKGVDIGSGYGGWPRMIAFERPDEVELVIGVELQEHVRELAEGLTEYAFKDLPDTQHRTFFWRDVGSDANDVFSWLEKHDTASGTHTDLDFMVSFLALLHIGQSLEDKARIFDGIANKLRPGGRIYIEDIVALPAVFNESRPELLEKLRSSLSMNAFPTHSDYSQMLRKAGFEPAHGSKAVVFDASAAWRNFVLTRSTAFQKFTDASSLCLLKNARVIPEMMPHEKDDEVSCTTLEKILGDTKLVNAYLASQSIFFCEVCELFNGRGTFAKADCQCGGDEEDHPPLVGGLIAFAARQ